MNSTSKRPSVAPVTWTWISLSSTGVSAGSLAFSAFVPLSPLGILSGLLVFGTLAGALARRHGWLAGIIVGFPFGLFQLTAQAAREMSGLSAVLAHPNYWRVAVPTAFLATGVAILGAMAGVWFLGTRQTK